MTWFKTPSPPSPPQTNKKTMSTRFLRSLNLFCHLPPPRLDVGPAGLSSAITTIAVISRTSCCPHLLGYRNPNTIEVTSFPFLLTLPGSGRGIGSLSGSATGMGVSLDGFQFGVPPSFRDEMDLANHFGMQFGPNNSYLPEVKGQQSTVRRRDSDVVGTEALEPSTEQKKVVAAHRNRTR